MLLTMTVCGLRRARRLLMLKHAAADRTGTYLALFRWEQWHGNDSTRSKLGRRLTHWHTRASAATNVSHSASISIVTTGATTVHTDTVLAVKMPSYRSIASSRDAHTAGNSSRTNRIVGNVVRPG